MKVKFDILADGGWYASNNVIFKHGIKSYSFLYNQLKAIQNEIFEYIPIDSFKKEILKYKISKKESSISFSFSISLDVDDDILFLLTLKHSKEYLNTIGMHF